MQIGTVKLDGQVAIDKGNRTVTIQEGMYPVFGDTWSSNGVATNNYIVDILIPVSTHEGTLTIVTGHSINLNERAYKKEIDFAIRAPFKLEKAQRHDYFGPIDRYIIIHENMDKYALNFIVNN